MSAGRSKVESGTNPPRPQHGLSLVTAPAAMPGRVSAAANAAAARSKTEFPRSTVASDTGQDWPASIRQLYLITADYLGGLKLWSNAAISCRWRSSVSVTQLTRLAGEAPLLCNYCLCNWDAILSLPATAANATCVLAYVRPHPVPVHCTGAGTAGDDYSREPAGGRLPSCLTLITRHGNKQTTNISTCKFAETRLMVKWQRYPIID